MSNLLYEGKAKRIYETDHLDQLRIEYKNQFTARNGAKKEEIEGKAQLNNGISRYIFDKLSESGIKHHFIKQLSATQQLVKKLEIIPLEVVVRNIVAGSLSQRLGIEEGTVLKEPLIEFYYKDDDLGDPLLTAEHIKILDLANDQDIENITSQARKINAELQKIFSTAGLDLVDFKLEFGRDHAHEIILADEISPDTCRLWDENKNSLDKDLFRNDSGDVIAAYQNIYDRLEKST